MDNEGRFCFRRTSEYRSTFLNSEYCVKVGCLDRESIENSIIKYQSPLQEGFSGVIYDVCELRGRIPEKCDKVIKIIPLSLRDTPEDRIRGAITYDCNPLNLDPNGAHFVNADCVVTTISQFEEEVEIGTLASKLGIGPKIYDSWICWDVELEIEEGDDTEHLEASVRDTEHLGRWTDDSQILGMILMEKLKGETLLDFVESNPTLFRRNFYILLSDGIEKALNLESHGYRHQDLHSKNIFIVDNGTKVMFIDYGDVSPFPDEYRYIKELFTMYAFLEEMLNSLKHMS